MQEVKLIVKYSKILKEKNLLPGSSGNISVRIGNKIFITPTNISKDELQTNKLSLIDINGKILNNIPPSSEYKMHIEIYKKRTDINAIIHTHPPFVLICMECNIKPDYNLTVEFKKIIGKPAYVNYIEPGSYELAQKVSQLSTKSNLIILEKHGIVCLGKNLSQARIIAEDTENLFMINYFVKLFNSKKRL